MNKNMGFYGKYEFRVKVQCLRKIDTTFKRK